MQTNTVKTSPSLLSLDTSSGTLTDEVLRRVGDIIDDGLRRVVSPQRNILASADRLYKHPFGRDTAISADKLLLYDRSIARQAALLMVATQGTKHEAASEEEPGKVFHEITFHSKDPAQQAVFDRLSATLGIGDGEKFISYTSIDATLEFIHMVAHYTELYGDELLHASVRCQGKTVTVKDGLLAAVRWLRGNIARSDSGLVGAFRTNPHGVVVADLLDGATSFVHADGKTLVNYQKEVNTINFQALAYQALQEAAQALPNHEERDAWLDTAAALRQKTIDHFWMPDAGRVAMALDRDSRGGIRQLKAISILPAASLRTGIFDGRPDIIDAVLHDLYTPDTMTCVGPRTETLRIDGEYVRYHEPPWPVLIGKAIQGAIRYHKDAIAIDLIERMLMGIYATGKAEEFHQVTADNKLGIYTEEPGPNSVEIVATNRPEAPQGWTVATVWWALHVALPLLNSRRSNEALHRNDTIDLTVNKTVRTVPYVLNMQKAHAIEYKIQAAAVVDGGR